METITDTRRDPSTQMKETITELVYSKGYDIGYRTCLSDLATLYKDSPDEFYKLLSPTPEEPAPVVVMAQEEETVVSYTKRPHRRHMWPDGVFESIRDYSIDNPDLTWEQLSEKSTIGYSGEAIKRQFLNHGIRSYKFRPDHRNA